MCVSVSDSARSFTSLSTASLRISRASVAPAPRTRAEQARPPLPSSRDRSGSPGSEVSPPGLSSRGLRHRGGDAAGRGPAGGQGHLGRRRPPGPAVQALREPQLPGGGASSDLREPRGLRGFLWLHWEEGSLEGTEESWNASGGRDPSRARRQGSPGPGPRAAGARARGAAVRGRRREGRAGLL